MFIGFYFTKLVNGVPHFEELEYFDSMVSSVGGATFDSLYNQEIYSRSVSEQAIDMMDDIFSDKEFRWLTPSPDGVYSLIEALTDAYFPQELINIVNVFLSTLAMEAETPLDEMFYRAKDIGCVQHLCQAYLDYHAYYCDSTNLEDATEQEHAHFFELMRDMLCE